LAGTARKEASNTPVNLEGLPIEKAALDQVIQVRARR
jgi:hypothetical protein